MTNTKYKINPLLAKLGEANKEPKFSPHLVALDGYIGSGEEKYLRLFSGLDFGEYIDIPLSEVTHVSYRSENPEDPCRVFFKSDCELKYIRTATFTASSVVDSRMTNSSSSSCNSNQSSLAARARDNGPELPPNNCELNCEMRRNTCEEFKMGWCSLKYYLCRLDCIYGSSGSTGPGGVIIL